MSTQPTNEFTKRLQERSSELANCQQEKQHKSCMECVVMLECERRKAYVRAVYESMSQGHGGGFEF